MLFIANSAKGRVGNSLVRSRIVRRVRPSSVTLIETRRFTTLLRSSQVSFERRRFANHSSLVACQRDFHSSSQLHDTADKIVGPAAIYADLVKSSEISEDPAQREVISHLDHVFTQVLAVKDEMEPDTSRANDATITSADRAALNASRGGPSKPKSSMSWLEKWAPSLLGNQGDDDQANGLGTETASAGTPPAVSDLVYSLLGLFLCFA
jgi:hypothetical protein